MLPERTRKWCYYDRHWVAPYCFNKDSSRRDGLSVVCRECERAKRLDWYARNRVRVSAQRKAKRRGTKT